MLTRNDVEREYRVRNGIILDSGKFESEPVYAPVFYQDSLDGRGDTLEWPDGTTSYVLNLGSYDHAEWPELVGCDGVHIAESESGFVACDPLTPDERRELLARNRRMWDLQRHPLAA